MSIGTTSIISLLVVVLTLGQIASGVNAAWTALMGGDELALCGYNDSDCTAAVGDLYYTYGIRVTGAWEAWELDFAREAAREMAFRFGEGDLERGQAMLRRIFRQANAVLRRVDRSYTFAGEDQAFAYGTSVQIPKHWLMEYDLDIRKFMVAHELGHVLDAEGAALGGALGGRWSTAMVAAIDAKTHCWLVSLCAQTGGYDTGPEAPVTEYSARSPNEDWANSFAAWVLQYPLGERRYAFVAGVVDSYRQTWQAE
jgi:hypothetical protein